ncbi:hypothetical protein VZT92_013718 [Zoarces viviparus]|uniref:Sperm microtubule inner protein 1 C-terminal domain-containing protein n=1 Tax=Zoarces viviparus TaxID=48416 RepID=A0AAW1F4G6_ZOAVI
MFSCMKGAESPRQPINQSSVSGSDADDPEPELLPGADPEGDVDPFGLEEPPCRPLPVLLQPPQKTTTAQSQRSRPVCPLTTAVLPPVSRTTEKRSALPPPAPPPPPVVSLEGDGPLNVAPLMRPVSPQTRLSLHQDSSHHGKGRKLYLQKRGHMRPEEKFDFPLLSSWSDYTLDYRTPSCAKSSSVVKNTFYARNGVFSSPSATDKLG